MTTAARARARSVGIIVACTIAIVSLVMSWRAISTQSDVAEREATRAVASVEETQQQLAATQEATRKSDCALMSLFRVLPGDPPPAPGRGVLVAERVEDAYRTRGCDRP